MEKARPWIQLKAQWLPGVCVEGERNGKVEHREFLELWNYSVNYHNGGYMPFIMLLSKYMEYTQTAYPNVNYGLYLIIIYQCQLLLH